jgi:hypothetical protein
LIIWAKHPQPVEIVAKDRILDPDEIVSGILDRTNFGDGFFGAPRLVRVDHYPGARPHRASKQVEPMEVSRKVRVADLDLECAVAKGVGPAEELYEFMVAEVKIQSWGVSADTIAPAAQELV